MSENRAEFLRRYVKVQTSLRSYLFSLLRRADDAEDVFQDVSVVLWDRYAEYDPAYPFLNWAFGIARNHAARWRRGRSRAPAWLPPEVEEKLAAAQAEIEDELVSRRRTLQDCVAKLGAGARELLRLRYEGAKSLQEIAQARRMTLNAVNKALGKIRRFLGECTGQARPGEA
jgi:RNA polymerase sigma-70 factor (ECF subfamily)